MNNQLKSLEAQALQLEPNIHQRKAIRQAVIRISEEFLKAVDEGPAYNSDMGEEWVGFFTEQGENIEQVLTEAVPQVDQLGINPASGFHLGYVPGGGVYTSALADYWADVTNRYAGVFYANPGSVRLENQLIRWMAGMVGYTDQSGGNLTSGGSIANLTAIVVARDVHKIDSTNIRKKVIYLTFQAHHCIDKALRIAGLSEITIRRVPMNEAYQMDPEELKKLLSVDELEGLEPWMVVASGGTTDTGAIDPLEEIGKIAEGKGLWYHVDAAYGGFFMLTDEGRKKMQGIAMADSVVMDPHKSLFLPYGSGVVLFKSASQAVEVLRYSASYMQDVIEEEDQISPADISIELTKHFRGLRMWLPLKLHGIAPFRAALQEKMVLARYAFDKLKAIQGIVTGPEPDISIVTFRYENGNGDCNQENQKIIDWFHNDGRVFISSTTIEGKIILRFAILVFRTHLKHVDMALSLLRESISTISKQEG